MYQGLGAILAAGGVMCVYGPFRYAGRYTSDSNRDFDRMLKSETLYRVCGTSRR